MLETVCDDCGLPELGVVRGRRFTVCLDPDCEPLAAAVAGVFDRAWDCPDCGSALCVRRRGGLLLVGSAAADCEWSRSFPTASFDGERRCGLPTLDGGCLDPDCAAPPSKA